MRRCPVCGSGRSRALSGYPQASLRRCGQCRAVFAGELPSQAELARHYAGYPSDYAPQPLTWQRYDELLERLERVRRTNRLLDFGAGHGYFLEAAARRGWEVHGVEFADQFIAGGEAKGFAMSRSLADVPQRAYDVVTALEVIEHVSDPHEQGTLLARAVRPGGLVYLTTPNFDSLSRRLLRERWRVICYPEHLTYFTPGTLRRMLQGVGLRCVEVRTSGLSVSDILGGRKASGADPGRIDTSVRSALGRPGPVAVGVGVANSVLGALRLGDTIKATFQASAG